MRPSSPADVGCGRARWVREQGCEHQVCVQSSEDSSTAEAWGWGAVRAAREPEGGGIWMGRVSGIERSGLFRRH